jgi:hypothetical protein
MPYIKILRPAGPQCRVQGLSQKCLWCLTWDMRYMRMPGQDTTNASSFTSASAIMATAAMATWWYVAMIHQGFEIPVLWYGDACPEIGPARSSRQQ